jgi:hypothetical protein
MKEASNDEIRKAFEDSETKFKPYGTTDGYINNLKANLAEQGLMIVKAGYAASCTPDGEKTKEHFKQVLKRYVTGFYFWWHNAKGTNTYQGYDDWEKDNDLTIDVLMREALPPTQPNSNQKSDKCKADIVAEFISEYEAKNFPKSSDYKMYQAEFEKFLIRLHDKYFTGQPNSNKLKNNNDGRSTRNNKD